MAQASVLTDSDIRRVFRIIETTRHAERNQSRSRKSAQRDKWSFCLTAGTLWPANQERP